MAKTIQTIRFKQTAETKQESDLSMVLAQPQRRKRGEVGQPSPDFLYPLNSQLGAERVEYLI
jgi:hypothetical protein